MPPKSPVSGAPRRRPWKLFVLPAAVGVPVILIFAVILCTAEPEALSPEEIIAKKEWSRQELTTALARSMAPAMTGQQRKEVMRHLSKELRKYPKPEREAIRRDAVVATVTISLDQLRKMPAEERKSVVETMEKRAIRTYTTLQSDPKKRKAFEKELKSSEMEAFTREVNRVIFSELTPDEKVKFAPVTKLWIKTMKSVGH
ncbi:MAG: hypothetical protein IKD44_11155 [Lentisphaeria bacterium]|nr:hypothetical protein [Lentisphaeria bacterium]